MNCQDLEYNDDRGLQYKLHYNFNYLIINLLSSRVGYTSGEKEQRDFGFFLEFGLPYYVNLSPSDLTFWSNRNDPASDLEVQREMQKYISGQNYFAVQGGLGCYWNFMDKIGLSIRAVRVAGLRDALNTIANPHGFINNSNPRSAYNVSVGLSFCVF
jgi:hypothetical protein